MRDLLKSVNIFLSTFGFVLDCNVDETRKFKIINISDKNGNQVGILEFGEETKYDVKCNITISSPQIGNLTANLLSREIEYSDNSGLPSFHSYEFGYTIKLPGQVNDLDAIYGNLNISDRKQTKDKPRYHISSEIRGHNYEKQENGIEIKNSSNHHIHNIEIQGERLAQIDIADAFIFSYVKNDGTLLDVRQTGGFVDHFEYIETGPTITINYVFPTGKEPYSEVLQSKVPAPIGSTSKIKDVMEIVLQTDANFYDLFGKASDKLTINGVRIYDNILSLCASNGTYTQEEIELLCGSLPNKTRNSPVLDFSGNLSFVGENKKKGGIKEI